MPLSAKQKSTGIRVLIIEYDNPRMELEKDDLACPFCDGNMHIVQGYIKRPHFRHNEACTSNLNYHKESPEHLEAKKMVREWILERPDYQDCIVDIEYAVPLAGRIADVMVTFPKGHQEAHEIQLASITVGEIDERTNSYQSQGIDTVWWLGQNACGKDAKAWVMEEHGQLLELFIEVEEFNKRNFK